MSLTAAELRKLAHTLGVKPDRVEMLAHLPAEDVRALRKQVAEALFQADRPHFVRVANIAKAVPVPIAAKVTQAVLPPLLAARSAELLDPARAAELVARLPDAYLADVSAAMDASRAPEVVAAIPPDRVARVGAELARRQEWVVIGGFVSAVDEQALAESIAIFDGEQLLRIGWVLEDPSRADAHRRRGQRRAGRGPGRGPAARRPLGGVRLAGRAAGPASPAAARGRLARGRRPTLQHTLPHRGGRRHARRRAAGVARGMTSDAPGAPDPVLLEVTRGGRVESRHRGSLVLLEPDGSVAVALGDPDASEFARSSLKPFQAAAMLRSGWAPPAASLALAAASHDGEAQHVEGARRTLRQAGLDESALGCPPALPADPEALLAWVAGGGREARICHNCSGKHAGMVATCAAAGWDVGSYLDPEHPLQQAIVAEIESRCGARITATTVDGCGAPAHAVPLAALARGFAALTTAAEGSPEAAVVTAIRRPSAAARREPPGGQRAARRGAGAAGEGRRRGRVGRGAARRPGVRGQGGRRLRAGAAAAAGRGTAILGPRRAGGTPLVGRRGARRRPSGRGDRLGGAAAGHARSARLSDQLRRSGAESDETPRWDGFGGT